MLRNYLKVTYRNLTRNWVYSVINILGLAIGLACSLLILLWVWDEVTYNRVLKNVDQLGTLMINNVYDDKVVTTGVVPYATYIHLKNFDSRIKNTCVTRPSANQLMEANGKRIVKDIRFVSEEFLMMFQYPLAKGSPSALRDPGAIVLSESTAQLLFPDNDPIGQMVRISNELDLKVAAIMKDLPHNSTKTFDALASLSLYSAHDHFEERVNNWRDESLSFNVVLEWQPQTDLTELNASLTKLFREKRGDGDKSELFILPVTDWRLRSNFENGKQVGGRIEYVRSFTAIAFFVLIIACINFMNLATARSERRAREVGIRKTVGSARKELIIQFLSESILIAVIAFFIALVIVELTLPLYNILVDKKLVIDYSSPLFWLVSIGFILITGIFAGSYPAFYLSSFNPVKVLKGNLHVGNTSVTPRKTLVVWQFGFSILLIIGVIGVYLQTQYLKSRVVGYDRENLIIISPDGITENYNEIKQELISSGIAKYVTTSNSPPTNTYKKIPQEWSKKMSRQDALFYFVATGYDYTQTLGVKIIEGRDFSERFNDSTKVILNQAAVDVLGLKNPVGEKISLWDSQWTVIGVMQNVLDNPFEGAKPCVYYFNPKWLNDMTVRLEKTTDVPNALVKIESIFKKYNPSYVFEYRFVDQEFEEKFSSINLIGNLTTLFSSLAIFISCLGLFGLAAFTAEQRTKEIGIRKVMGASASNVVMLLSKDFARLVLISFAIASPLAWWLLNQWLETYSFRINLSLWIFITAGSVTVLLAVVTVSSQALRAALADPSQSLRTE